MGISICHKSVGVEMGGSGPQRAIKKISLACTRDSVLKESVILGSTGCKFIHLQ